MLTAGESETIEFKTSFGRETIETLVAFANTAGGTVLVGINGILLISRLRFLMINSLFLIQEPSTGD